MATLAEYLATDETNHPHELRWGTVVREPAAPTFEHQRIVTRLVTRLETHVARRGLGVVVPSPIDVVLDVERGLVLQPDIAFVSAGRQAMCRDRIWGAPDLVVEVLSNATRRRDQVAKAAWYAQYGVQEVWMVDSVSREVAIGGRVFEGADRVQSRVFPRLRLTAERVFVDRDPFSLRTV